MFDRHLLPRLRATCRALVIGFKHPERVSPTGVMTEREALTAIMERPYGELNDFEKDALAHQWKTLPQEERRAYWHSLLLEAQRDLHSRKPEPETR